MFAVSTRGVTVRVGTATGVLGRVALSMSGGWGGVMLMAGPIWPITPYRSSIWDFVLAGSAPRSGPKPLIMVSHSLMDSPSLASRLARAAPARPSREKQLLMCVA